MNTLRFYDTLRFSIKKMNTLRFYDTLRFSIKKKHMNTLTYCND